MASTAQHASKFQRFKFRNRSKDCSFWAPVFKWALVIAGINDLQRPVEN